MKALLIFLFGKRADPVCTIKPGCRTVYPKFDYPYDYGDWCKEFNVSMLHDRKPICLD